MARKSTGTTAKKSTRKTPTAKKAAPEANVTSASTQKEQDVQVTAAAQKKQSSVTQNAITENVPTPPAKAGAVSPAVKEAQAPVVKTEQALTLKEEHAPMMKEAKSPVIKEEYAPALKETQSLAVKETQSPVVKETHTPMVKEAAASPVIKEKTEVVLKEKSPAPAIKEKAKVTAVKRELDYTPANLGSNPYLPHVCTVKEVIRETHNIMTFRVVIDDEEVMKNFSHQAGQVGQLSLFGAGESTFVINSPPSNKEYLQFSVMRTGEVTEALHRLSPGDKVGVRAPLGNAFPREQWKGKDIFFVGGGIGMAPIRTIMLDVLEHKEDYGKISLLYGARSPKDMAFSYELEGWQKHPDLHCHLTIDSPCEGWECLVGLIPNILTEIAPDPKKTVVVLCGPPIMIKFTVQALEKMNFPDESIITTLEKRMKCGIGICGRCNLGSEYVCVSGPVYSWAQLKQLPPEL